VQDCVLGRNRDEPVLEELDQGRIYSKLPTPSSLKAVNMKTRTSAGGEKIRREATVRVPLRTGT
jgi:hypothetical protein